MTTKTIFDLVMPDLQERRAQMELIIASHSNPTFAAKVCGDLSPLFFFYTQKSWELLDDTEMMTEVEDCFKAANKRSVDFIKMASWLLLLLEQQTMEEEHKLIHRLIARHLVSTEKRKPKFPKRLLQVIDKAGKPVRALELFYDETNSLIDDTFNIVSNDDDEEDEDEKETYINDDNTYLDKNDRIKRKSDAIVESFSYEKGTPLTDWASARDYSKRLIELKEKEKTVGLSEKEREERKDLVKQVFMGKPRWSYPRTDKVTANLRRGFKYFCTKLDEKIENPKFGSDFVKEGFRSGRACIWKDKGICRKKENHHIPDFEAFSQYLPINTTDEESIKAQASWETLSDEQKKLWLACYAMDTQARRFYLEGVLLQQANLADLNLINTFYEAGRQKDLFVAYEKPDSLEEIYEMVREKDVDAYSGYMGSKNNFFKYLEAGLSYCKII